MVVWKASLCNLQKAFENYTTGGSSRMLLPITVTPLCTAISPGTVASQLPPASAAKSTTTDPCFIAASISVVINFGAGFPGMRACDKIRAERSDRGDQTNSSDYDVNFPTLFFE